jgi:hypothetical protein
MATIYRKSLKGIDELASKAGNIPMRLLSYLVAVDGVSSVDELSATHPHLPSMDVIFNGLMQQGFIEVVSTASRSPASPRAAANPVAAPAAAPGIHLESIKGNMVRDVSTLLGSDAGPVIKKIQNCQTQDDLFAAMMGIKKIVSLYVDKSAGESFAGRYAVLSS